MRTLDAIDAVAAVLVLVGIPGRKNNVRFLRAAERVRLDSSRTALIIEIDAKPVGSGKADDFEMGLQKRRHR